MAQNNPEKEQAYTACLNASYSASILIHGSIFEQACEEFQKSIVNELTNGMGKIPNLGEHLKCLLKTRFGQAVK